MTSTSMSVSCEKLTREQPAAPGVVERQCRVDSGRCRSTFEDLIGFSFRRFSEWTSLGVTYQGNENWENQKQKRCEDSQDRDCLLKERSGSCEGGSKSHLINEQQTNNQTPEVVGVFSLKTWELLKGWCPSIENYF